MKYIFLILLLLYSWLYVSAQIHLSIEDCLEYGFRHNLKLSLCQNEVSESKIRLKQSQMACLPSIRTEYNHFMSSGRSLNPETYTWSGENIQQGNITLKADLTIFQGLFNLYERKASQTGVEISNHILERERLILGLDIIKCFHCINSYQSDIDILENTLFITQAEIRKLEEQIEAGIIPKGDLFEMQAQEKKEMIRIYSLRASLEKEYENLKQLMNWQEVNDPAIDVYSITTNMNHVIEVDDLSPVVNDIVRNSVLIAVETNREKQLEYELQKQKSHWYPVLSAYAALSSRYLKGVNDLFPEYDKYGLFSQLTDNQYKQIGLTVSVSIFEGRHKQMENNLSEIQLSKKKTETQQQILSLKTDLLKIQHDILTLAERIKVIKLMAEAYQRSYECAEEKYISGLLDLYSLNIAKNNCTNALIEWNRLNIEHKLNMDLMGLYRKFVVAE
ncbi:MAG: TolC family protein [Bacteroidales bacterium]|nr:TolC family protein [Bacteroidales bacterium]